jgi:hypothetical protein
MFVCIYIYVYKYTNVPLTKADQDDFSVAVKEVNSSMHILISMYICLHLCISLYEYVYMHESMCIFMKADQDGFLGVLKEGHMHAYV